MANLDKLKNLNPKQFMKYNRIEKVQVDETTVQNLKKKSTLCAMELKRILLDESNKRVLTKTGLSLNGKWKTCFGCSPKSINSIAINILTAVDHSDSCINNTFAI